VRHAIGRIGLLRRAMPTAIAILLLTAQQAGASPQQMHIMEGFLPWQWCILWFGVAVPFWIHGFRRMRRVVSDNPETRLLLAVAAAFTFVLSALKMPSVTGSCSHPTGTGLGAILFGPTIMSLLGGIVLLFQALLLAHGGLTTLGANTVSMGIVGPLVGWAVWVALRDRVSPRVSVFLAAALADLMTYVTTSIQLALAYPDPATGIAGSFLKFAAIFAVTQVPLAISEGILTVLIFAALRSTAQSELKTLKVIGG